jgi:hypothetical protein
MSNPELFPSEKVQWRKPLKLKRETLERIRREADEANRSEIRQVEWIIEEYYRQSRSEAKNG